MVDDLSNYDLDFTGFPAQEELEAYDIDSAFLTKLKAFLHGESRETQLDLILESIRDEQTLNWLWNEFGKVMNWRHDYILEGRNHRRCTFLVKGFDKYPFIMESFFDPVSSMYYCIRISMRRFKAMRPDMLTALLSAQHRTMGQNSAMRNFPLDVVHKIISDNGLGHVHVAEHRTRHAETVLAALRMMYDEERGRIDAAIQDVLDNFQDDDYGYENAKQLRFTNISKYDFSSFYQFIVQQLADDSKVRVLRSEDNKNYWVVHLLKGRPSATQVIFGVEFINNTDILVTGIGLEDSQPPFTDPDSLFYFMNRIQWLKSIVARAQAFR